MYTSAYVCAIETMGKTWWSVFCLSCITFYCRAHSLLHTVLQAFIIIQKNVVTCWKRIWPLAVTDADFFSPAAWHVVLRWWTAYYFYFDFLWRRISYLVLEGNYYSLDQLWFFDLDTDQKKKTFFYFFLTSKLFLSLTWQNNYIEIINVLQSGCSSYYYH